MSTAAANEMGFPLSVDSASESRWAFFATKSASRFRQAARSVGGVADQLLKALCADSTARFTSSTPDLGNRP